MATSLQFNIRSLLMLMVVTAVVMAAVAPVVRSWETPQRLWFLAEAALLGAIVAGFTVQRCIVRRKTVRLAGEVILRTRTQGNRLVRLQQGALLAVFVFFLGVTAVGDAQTARWQQLPIWQWPWFSMAMLGWIASRLLTNFWWGVGPGIVELAEKGLIEWGTRLVPYARFRTFRWNRYTSDTLVLSSREYRLTLIVIPHEHRPMIEQFFRDRGLISSGPGPTESSASAETAAGGSLLDRSG